MSCERQRHHPRRERPPQKGVGAASDAADAYAHAAQLLRRLQLWGYLKVAGYEQNAAGRGRPRKAYTVTERGRKYLKWYGRSGKEE